MQFWYCLIQKVCLEINNVLTRLIMKNVINNDLIGLTVNGEKYYLQKTMVDCRFK